MSSIKKGRILRTAAILAATALLFVLPACHRSTATSTSEDEPTPDASFSPVPTPATEFERDMKYVRDAHFKYVWVLTRFDGREFTKEDGDFLRENAPKVVDWVGTDQKRKYIAGSNFDLDPTQMAALQKRYKVEDYSGK